MEHEPFALVARVTKTHGLKGEVSVVATIETPLSVLVGCEVWFVPPPAGVRTAIVESVRPGPKGDLLTLSTVGDVDAAKTLVGREVLVSVDALPAGWDDLAAVEESFDGYTVRDAEHGLLGEIVETIVTGANDVWVVDGPLGQILIPVIDQVVIEIDESASSVEVLLLPGLLDGEE
jgi:16S rRNA processing protein RimM